MCLYWKKKLYDVMHTRDSVVYFINNLHLQSTWWWHALTILGKWNVIVVRLFSMLNCRYDFACALFCIFWIHRLFCATGTKNTIRTFLKVDLNKSSVELCHFWMHRNWKIKIVQVFRSLNIRSFHFTFIFSQSVVWSSEKWKELT